MQKRRERLGLWAIKLTTNVRVKANSHRRTKHDKTVLSAVCRVRSGGVI